MSTEPIDPIDRLVADLTEAVERGRFSAVVLVEDGDRTVLELAAGLANRADGLSMRIDTRLATASGTKGFTALTVVSMIEEGIFGFDTPLIDVVGELPNVDPLVTIEHLLGHTSGIGDYLDEEILDDPDDYVLDVPVHQLLGPEDFVPILGRHPQKDPPGTRFKYNNGGYLWLALAIERGSGRSYHDEVRRRVFEPAGMTNTDFLRNDHLPAGVALGYLTDGRTNVLHLPVIGTGDGGAYTTAPDMMRFWAAFLGGDLVGPDLVAKMSTVTSEGPPDRYGLGFWIGPDARTVQLEGRDAGVSLRSGAHPDSGFRYCIIANNSSDVWPLAAVVDRYVAAGG